MSNTFSLSLNSSGSPSEGSSNNEQLLQNTNNKNNNNKNNDNKNNNNNDIEPTTQVRHYSFKEKFISTFLNIKPKRKKTTIKENKIIEDEFIKKNIEFNKKNTFETESNLSEDYEETTTTKYKNIVRKVLKTKKNKTWGEFLEEYEKKMKEEKSLKLRMKNIFNVNSDLIIIWKLTFSAFNIIFIFIYFLKYLLL